MSKEINPRLVFERLFGSISGHDSAKNRERHNFFRKSILDAVGDDAAKLSSKLGQSDRRKLDESFQDVREIELRISRAQADSAPKNIPNIELPQRIPSETSTRIFRLMFDLLAIAFETDDSTRVATFMLANEGSNRSYSMVGSSNGHHHLSHHQNKANLIDPLKKIDKYLISHFARFLEKLKNTSEGDGRSSDHSMMVLVRPFPTGIVTITMTCRSCSLAADAVRSNLVGHLVYPTDTPLNNLFLSLLDRMNAGVDQLGDGTGRLDRLDP